VPDKPKPFSSSDVLQIQVVGLEQLQAKFGEAEERFRRAIARTVNQSLINIDREAKREAPVNDGQLRAGIHFTVATPENPVGVVGSYAKHAAWMEFGTGPHGAETNRQPLPPWYEHGPNHKFPPAAAFERWGQKHPIKVAGRRKKQAMPGYFWARVIFMNQGVAARPYFYPAAMNEAPRFEERLEAAIKDVIGGGK
jgi:hypothetical protein